MIERITLKDCATYRHSEALIENPKQVNFFYGANGSGKTTISRTIAGRGEFTGNSSVAWVDGKKLETYVYDRDFLDESFDSRDDLPGVFTLGSESVEIVKSIAILKTKVAKLENKKAALDAELDSEEDENNPKGLKQKLEQLEAEFLQQVWDGHARCDDSLKDAFKGLRNSKAKFRDRLLQEAMTNSAKLVEAERLIERAKTVFNESPKEEAKIGVPNYSTLASLETEPLLGKVIVGKADVAIAEMIDALGNSDWVGKGRPYFDENGDVCPFCQRKTDAAFRSSLEAYFNKAHDDDKQGVETIERQYVAKAEELLTSIENIVASPSEFLDLPTMQAQVATLKTLLLTNRQLLKDKCAALSKCVSLQSIEDVMLPIRRTLNAANLEIEKRNELCRNLGTERKRLTDEVWQLLVGDLLKKEIEVYQSKRTSLSASTKKLLDLAQQAAKDSMNLQSEIKGLEASRTNVLPTIEKINNILGVYGFQGFKLAPAEGAKSYKVVRTTGEDAKKSLSEGEKTLVGFLYFYFLAEGSLSSTGVTSERVIVIDDPVSSLDSDTLFVVSSLVREVVMSVARDNTPIKQLFVLTHNIYFHKEVCYSAWKNWTGEDGKELSAPKIAYWVVTKRDGKSTVHQHERNPISSNYELLWAEIFENDNTGVTVQNCMRRVLEHYFRFVGRGFKQGLLEKFSGDAGHICRSLLSWVNDGSHNVLDDLHAPMSNNSTELYRDAFQLIFVEADHGAHHEMMKNLVLGAQDAQP